MWFKNIVVYRLAAGWVGKAEELEEKLARQPLQKCGGFDMETRGWVCPRHEGEYVYQQNRQWLFALGFEQKLLPSSVIRQVAEERIVELEAKLGHPMGRKQKRDMKEKVTAELMPRAFAKRRRTYGWIDSANRWLAVDAAGEPQAEAFLETLRRAEDLPVTRLETQMSPSTAMSRWVLAGDVPGPFTIDQDLELRAPDASKATVRYARHGLEGRDIRDHISGGKQPVRLGLTWNDRISFVLTEQLHVKRLAFLDILKREGGEEEVEDDEARFEIDFALMTGELARMLADLAEVLGGEKAAEGRPAAGRRVEETVA